jgi:hypothetical protein
VSNNASAFRVLDSKIAMLAIVGNLPDTCVPAVAVAIDLETKRTITASTTPYGVAWKPKKDGKAFSFVKTSDVITDHIGRTIFTRIKIRHVVLHHLGYAKGEIERQVIPSGRIPATMSAAIKRAVVREFEKAKNGGGAP